MIGKGENDPCVEIKRGKRENLIWLILIKQ
jgi:hypothetical protein